MSLVPQLNLYMTLVEENGVKRVINDSDRVRRSVSNPLTIKITKPTWRRYR